MKINILEQKDNPFFKRKEVIVNVDYEGGPTPKKSEIQEEVSKIFNVNVLNVEVLKVLSSFGKPEGKAWINIWKELPEHLKPKEEKKEVSEESPKEEKKEGE